MKILLTILLTFISFLGASQNYQVSVGGSGTPESTCTGTLYDNGGAGNYPSTVGTFTETFCAPTANDIVSLDFSSINLSQGGSPGNNDFISIYIDGTLLWTSPADFVGSNQVFNSVAGGCITVSFEQNGSNNGNAPGFEASISCIDASTIISSPGSYTTCGGIFSDEGGITGFGSQYNGYSTTQLPGFYPNNTTSATYTFCSNDPMNPYVTLSFDYFYVDLDEIVIIDGDGPADPIINEWTLNNSPGTITSSNGCLTIVFGENTDNWIANGWEATISCSSSPGTHSTICSSANCNGGCGYTICVSGEFDVNTGAGVSVEELLSPTTQGCNLQGEVNSTWYYFSPATSGTLGFEIDPPNGLDFDYALWGPYTNGGIECPLSTGDAPIRCSYAAANGTVGLVDGAGDFTEGAGGDNWTEDLNVIAGEVYVMLINSYSSGAPAAQPVWTWTGTATLDCTPLPIELVSFDGFNSGNKNLLYWLSASEYNNDYYTIEVSQDGKGWSYVSTVDGVGTTTIPTNYDYVDYSYKRGYVNYYRLTQTDFDGRFEVFNIIAIDNRIDDKKVSKITNLLGQEVDRYYRGVKIVIYEDGSIIKLFN